MHSAARTRRDADARGVFSRTDVVEAGFSRDPPDGGHLALKRGGARASGLLSQSSFGTQFEQPRQDLVWLRRQFRQAGRGVAD